MKVLFDQGTPAPLRRAFGTDAVETAFERQWDNLQNGALIEAAEAAGFDVFITTDKNLWYQQNLRARRVALDARVRVRQSPDDDEADGTPSLVLGDAMRDVDIAKRHGMPVARPRNDEGTGIGI